MQLHKQVSLNYDCRPYYSIFSFMCMFCGSLFVPLYFFSWPLCCLFFLDIRILITSLWYLQALLTGDKIFVIVIESSFVEQVEEPSIYLSLYGFLWSFGIQYNVGKSSYSSYSEYFLIKSMACALPNFLLRQKKTWTMIGLFWVPLECQLMMANSNLRYYSGYLNCISDLTIKIIFVGLSNAPRNIFRIY